MGTKLKWTMDSQKFPKWCIASFSEVKWYSLKFGSLLMAAFIHERLKERALLVSTVGPT